MLNPVFHYLSAIIFIIIGVQFYFNSTVPAIAIIFVLLAAFQIFLARAIRKFKLDLLKEYEESSHENAEDTEDIIDENS